MNNPDHCMDRLVSYSIRLLALLLLPMHLAGCTPDSAAPELSNDDTAFHAAAYKHVSLLEGQPFAVLENNVIGTHLLIKKLRASSVRRLVLISSEKAVQPQGITVPSKNALPNCLC